MPPTKPTMVVTIAGLRKGQDLLEADIKFLRACLASSPVLNPDLIAHRAATIRKKGPKFAPMADALDKLPPMATTLRALATKNLPASGARLIRIIHELDLLETKLDSPRRRAGIDYVMQLLTDPNLPGMVQVARFLDAEMTRIRALIKKQKAANAAEAEDARRREAHLRTAELALAGSLEWRETGERARERERMRFRREWERKPEPASPPVVPFGQPPKGKWVSRIKHESFR